MRVGEGLGKGFILRAPASIILSALSSTQGRRAQFIRREKQTARLCGSGEATAKTVSPQASASLLSHHSSKRLTRIPCNTLCHPAVEAAEPKEDTASAEMALLLRLPAPLALPEEQHRHGPQRLAEVGAVVQMLLQERPARARLNDAASGEQVDERLVVSGFEGSIIDIADHATR